MASSRDAALVLRNSLNPPNFAEDGFDPDAATTQAPGFARESSLGSTPESDPDSPSIPCNTGGYGSTPERSTLPWMHPWNYPWTHTLAFHWVQPGLDPFLGLLWTLPWLHSWTNPDQPLDPPLDPPAPPLEPPPAPDGPSIRRSARWRRRSLLGSRKQFPLDTEMRRQFHFPFKRLSKILQNVNLRLSHGKRVFPRGTGETEDARALCASRDHVFLRAGASDVHCVGQGGGGGDVQL